jgi:hypothetical protein
MQRSFWLAALMAAALTAQARDAHPPDVTVFVSGDDTPPAPVEYTARSTVTWIFARAGVRLAWRDGEPAGGADTAAAIRIHYTRRLPPGAGRSALAVARPFGAQGIAVDILYDRIRWVAASPRREPAILAHVLAHEIGHVLEGTDWHAPSGVMKAHWSGPDYDAMEKCPLDFTPLDRELLREGLAVRRLRRADAPGSSTVPQPE